MKAQDRKPSERTQASDKTIQDLLRRFLARWSDRRIVASMALLVSAVLAVVEGIRGNRFGYLPLLLVVSLILIYVGYRHEWTGFGPASYEKEESKEMRLSKTLWDWMSLLFVPLMLAAATAWFTWSQNTNQQAVQAQNSAVQTYLDQMQELMIDKGLLLHSAEGAPEGKEAAARRVARARTLSVLRGLSPDGKRAVLLFLYDSGLIRKGTSTLDLDNADLTGANLAHANLESANLSGVHLENANLKEVNLKGADLNGSYLEDAYLEDVNLANANLREAQLRGADLEGACLKEAALPAANKLSLADLEDANLYHAALAGKEVVLDGDVLPTLKRAISNLRHAGLRGTPDTDETTLQKAIETDIEDLPSCK